MARELWKMFDENRNSLHCVVVRNTGPRIPKGMYHIVVECILVDKHKQMLITRRAPGKHHPNTWECTTGSIIAGEDSLAGVKRELFEETGLRGELFQLLRTEVTDCVIRDTYVCYMDEIPIDDVKLQEDETTAAKLIPIIDYVRGKLNEDPEYHFLPSQYERVYSLIGLVLDFCKKQSGQEASVPEQPSQAETSTTQKSFKRAVGPPTKKRV